MGADCVRAAVLRRRLAVTGPYQRPDAPPPEDDPPPNPPEDPEDEDVIRGIV